MRLVARPLALVVSLQLSAYRGRAYNMWLGFFTGFSVCLVFPKKIRKRGSQVYKYDYQKNQKWAESARRAPAGSHEWGLWHHHALRLGPEMYSLGLSFFVTMQQLWCAAGYYCTVRLLARLNQVYNYGYQKVEVAVSYSPRDFGESLHTICMVCRWSHA